MPRTSLRKIHDCGADALAARIITISEPKPPKPTDLRRHRTATDRHLLIGFFIVLFSVGGGLIALFYGAGAAALGVLCMGLGALLAALVILVVLGFEWLSNWLENRD